MTELTITEVYAIGLPIILAMIVVETLISGFNKKSLYKNINSKIFILFSKIYIYRKIKSNN